MFALISACQRTTILDESRSESLISVTCIIDIKKHLNGLNKVEFRLNKFSKFFLVPLIKHIAQEDKNFSSDIPNNRIEVTGTL